MNQFAKLNQQYIGGAGETGRRGKYLVNRNPFNQKTICEFKLGNVADLDEAYRSAAAAQKIWAGVNAYEKRAILEKAHAFVEKNEAEITDIDYRRVGRDGAEGVF